MEFPIVSPYFPEKICPQCQARQVVLFETGLLSDTDALPDGLIQIYIQATSDHGERAQHVMGLGL